MISLFKVLPYGDGALHVQFQETISEEGFEKVQNFFNHLSHLQDERILELIPTYHSVTVFYRPGSSYLEMLNLVEEVHHRSTEIEMDTSRPALLRKVEIPVCYGGEFGPDLKHVADYHKLTVEEVIARHTASEYLVYMIGFMPGFPYMGGLDPELATPRLISPRSLVPQGSVGIAGQQTGLYPLASPGGWQLIGRTPLSLFDANYNPPTMLRSGDRVRFMPISRKDYNELEGKRS